MNARQIKLYTQRGQLRERIRHQREQLGQEMAPIRLALGTVDATYLQLQRAQVWLQKNPLLVSAAVVTLLVWRPRATIKAARRAFSLWRSWGQWKLWLEELRF